MRARIRRLPVFWSVMSLMVALLATIEYLSWTSPPCIPPQWDSPPVLEVRADCIDNDGNYRCFRPDGGTTGDADDNPQ